MPDKTPEQLAEEIQAKFDKSISDVKEIALEAKQVAESGKQASQDLKEKADEGLIAMNTLQEQMTEFEQKMSRDIGSAVKKAQTLGSQFVDDERVKTWLSGEPSNGKMDLRVKATLTSLITDVAGAVGNMVETTRLPGVLELPQRRMTVRDLISAGQMDGNALEYVRETGFTNNASMVAEGDLKPQSDIKMDLITTSAKVIAHHMKASRQILSDASQLKSLIDQRLLYGLAYQEENQLLNGDGTGQNLHGLLPQATAYAAPFAVANETIIDRLRLASLQAVLAEYPSTGIVMNPLDWAKIELQKDANQNYIIGKPQGAIGATLWRLPVVETQAMVANNFLTGAFKMAAQLFDRWDARVEVGYVNDDFTRNLVTVLGEERLALAVYRPEAFVTGDFTIV